MDTEPQRTVWSRIYGVSTWALIVYFGVMAFVHLVLAVLFYLGVWDTGVGYFLDYDWPAPLIAILDGMAALLLWAGYRKRAESPWLGLLLTVAASIIMLGRAMWFVIVPLAVVLTIAGSIRTLKLASRSERIHT